MLPEKIGDRYRVIEELGRGGMGVVYLAEDEGSGRRVALKILLARRFTDTGLRHFEQEFRTLTSLSHPNLTEVFDFGRVQVDDGARQVPFFTMEFVDGETLDRHFDPGRDDFAVLYDCLAQVAVALAYLHGRGFLHQDVKPSNILVTGGDGGRHVKLMDLGLAGPVHDADAPGRIRGTAAYLSPESARGATLDPRADLYSLGCVAYRLATGRPPFQGGSAIELIRAHLQETPLPPSTLNREVPAALDALILSLLEKDPGLRPASADRLLKRLDEVAGGTLRIETPERRRQRVLGPGFVGREAELERLERLLAEASGGRGRVVFLVGEAGVGKSRLAREFQVRCQLQGVDVHVGRPDGAGASGALGEALGRALRAREPLAAATLELHGRALESLAGSVPGVDGAAESGESPSFGERYKLFAAVSAAVDELSRGHPVVLVLEDLHRADETTCALLTHLAGTLASTEALVLGTFRTDEVSRSSPLFDLLAEGRGEGVFEEVFLTPLGPPETERMLRAMLGCPEIPHLFLQRIIAETHGNPLYLQELVALLAEDGLVEPGAAEPPDPEVLNRVELPGKVRDLLDRRFSRLGADAKTVLRAAAILGAPDIEPDAVAAITGMRWEAVVRELLDLRSGGLVQREEDDAGTPVYRVMPALAALAGDSAGQDEARRLHAGAAAYLERRGIPRAHGAWAAFARHAEAAGQPGRAQEASRRAGDLARELYAHREAIELYGRAIELALRDEAAPAAVVCGLYAGRGESYALVGDLQRAEEDFRWMLARAEKGGDDGLRAGAHLALGRVLGETGSHEQAQDNLEIAMEIARRLGEAGVEAEARIALGRVLFRLGDYEGGEDHLDRAGAAARGADRRELEVEALVAKGMLLREQGNFRRSLEAFRQAGERTSGRASAAVEGAIEEGSALALEVQGKHAEAIAAYERARARARERGDVRAVASLTTQLGTAYVKVGDYDRARQELDRALDEQRRLGSREGQILAQHGLAVLHVYRGRYENGLEAAEEALRLSRQVRHRERVASALHLIGSIHLRVGDLERAAAHLEEARQIARDVRSVRALAAVLVELGDLHRFREESEPARREYQEATFLARKLGDRRLESVAMGRLGEAHLLDNNHDRARVACRKALELVQGSGLPREEADSLLLRARIELGRPGGDVVRAEMDALTALERYRSLSEPEQIWQAEHVVARAALRLGRPDEAAARTDRAYRYVDAVRGRLGPRFRDRFLGDPRRRELVEDWQRIRSRVAAAEERDAGPQDAVGGDYARLQEEAAALRRLLDVNRRLGGVRDPDEWVSRLVEAARELTGAERGAVVWAEGAEVAPGTAAPADVAAARAVAQSVLESGDALVSPSVADDDRLSGHAALRDSKVRSALAVPLAIRDEVVGVVVLEHRGDGRFGPGHLDIATQLADQAALALENLRLVRKIQEQSERVDRLNRELERTVQTQRTELASVREELSFTRSSFELRYRFEDLVGASNSMQRVYHLIERLAPKRLPVLITGESGTGKELIARALHSKSDRSDGPFFSVNCAALAETLLESELFGHKRGAFTGADRDKPGYFELAHRGTLFLDEIGDTGEAMQAKLLRAIERGEVLPVGGKSPVRVDVRIVSATHRDLEAWIAGGKFREDLYYRINVARVRVPPLRERLEDIPLLVEHFLGLLAEEEGQPKRDIEPAALERLAAYDWPGNVRELHHRILRVATFSRGDTLTLKDIRRYGDLPAAGTRPVGTTATGGVESLEEMERRQIARALAEADGNKTRAAELLGINRATLFRKLKRFGL